MTKGKGVVGFRAGGNVPGFGRVATQVPLLRTGGAPGATKPNLVDEREDGTLRVRTNSEPAEPTLRFLCVRGMKPFRKDGVARVAARRVRRSHDVSDVDRKTASRIYGTGTSARQQRKERVRRSLAIRDWRL